jgi:hypothetical protein
VDNLTATLILTFSLPILAIYYILDRLNPLDGTALRIRRAGICSNRAELMQLKFAGEFHFERAIEAYEELIDSTFADGQP